MQKMSIDQAIQLGAQRPSLNDRIGSPSLHDKIQNILENNPITSAISHGINVLANNPITQSINDIGGSVASGLASGMANTANLPADLINSVAKTNIPKFQGLPQAPFVNQNDPTNDYVQGAAQFAVPGKAADEIAGAIGVASPLIKGIMTGGLGGILGSPSGQRIVNGGIGAAGGAVAAPIATVASKIPGGISNIVNAIKTYQPVNKLDDMTSSLYNTISGGTDKNALNTVNSNGIIANYNTQKAISTAKYNNVLSSANNAGYLPDAPLKYDATAQQVVPSNGSKVISMSPNTAQLLNNVLNPTAKMDTKAVSQPLQDAVSLYKNSPSLNNAHLLQSKMFAEAQDFLGSTTRDASDQKTGGAILKLRDNFNKDIQSSLIKNGDQPIAAQMADASQNFKQNVVPYTAAPAIRSLVVKDAQPVNVLNTLAKGGQRGAYDAIRGHIAQNPAQQNYLLAQQLSPKAESNPNDFNAIGKILNLDDATKQYLKAPDNLKTVFNPQSVNALQTMNNAKNAYTNLLPNIVKNNKKLAIHLAKSIATGAGIGLGVEGIHKVGEES